jgi:hypothetical protein
MNEHNTQRMLVAWFRKYYPEQQNLLFAIPNGGKRNPATAKRLKEEGVLPGIPDLCLAAPSPSGAHGLFIEMKTTSGRLSAAQKQRKQELEQSGYSVAVAFGYEAAKQAIEDYLSEVA